MIKIVATYGRGKPIEFRNVTKVVYSTETGTVSVENDDILKHIFPLATELTVYASGGISTVSCQGLRAQFWSKNSHISTLTLTCASG